MEIELNTSELEQINGGGIGGLIVGSLVGSTVALVGAPILCVAGRSEDEV